MSVKNQLQEIFQKKQLSLPRYQTIRVGGSAHQPLWQSTITIYDGTQFIGLICTDKINTELSAAENALTHLLQNHNSFPQSYQIINRDMNVETNHNSVNIGMLVDLENMPKFIHNISNKLHKYTIYVFVGEHHCLVEKELPPEVIKIISPSTRSDGTDTCMQVYTGMLLSLEKHEEYIIVTRDHFGSALVEMITSTNLGWVPKLGRIVTSPSQL